MLTSKPWVMIIVRVLLIAIITSNALIPTSTIAMPVAEGSEVNSVSVMPDNSLGSKSSVAKYGLLSLRSSKVFQDSTPTGDGTAITTPTNVPTSAPTDTVTEVVTGTSTPEPPSATTTGALEPLQQR